MESSHKEILLNWYYEHLQAAGRTQSRLLWAVLILSFVTISFYLDPQASSNFKYLDFPLKNIKNFLPTAIFLVLVILQGNFIAVKVGIKKLNSEFSGEQNVVKDKSLSLYPIDKNLNFLDYISNFIEKKEHWKRFANLLYPTYIVLVAIPAILLLFDQIKLLFSNWTLRLAVPAFLNICFFVGWYIFSHDFFKSRWKKFSNNEAINN